MIAAGWLWHLRDWSLPTDGRAAPGPISADLRAAIDGLYAAFDEYARLPVPTVGLAVRPHPWTDRLGSAPLRRLGPTDLDAYARKAVTSWGTVDDFRHYLPRLLPRLLEVAAEDGQVGGDPVNAMEVEILFDKLPYAGWRTWPVDEQAAVEAYLRALWRNVCRVYAGPWMIDACLWAIGQLTDDLTPFLADWRPDRSRDEALRFAELVASYDVPKEREPGQPWRLDDGWGYCLPGTLDQVTAWLLSPDRAAEVERAFFAFGTDDATAAPLSVAAAALAAVHRAAGGPRTR